MSFLATTAFNFASISVLLWAAYSTIESKTLATVAAYALGMLVSMLFCLDFWWTRVSRQMTLPVAFEQRLTFLGIATVSAVIATAVVRVGTSDTVRSSAFLIALNWVVLGLISLAKYIVMIAFIPNVRRFLLTRLTRR